MIEIHDLWLFIVAGLLLNLTPGADMLYILSRSSSQGIKAGMVASLGIGVGCVFHVLFAALGLSALLAASATAFTVLKYLGAAYLIYLGIKTLWSLREPTQQGSGDIAVQKSARPMAAIFREAVLVNILNPKVALFFLAFLPQFVAPEATSKVLTLVVLGLIFNINSTLVNMVIATVAAYTASRIEQRTSGRLGKWLKAMMASVFIGLGLRLATEEARI